MELNSPVFRLVIVTCTSHNFSFDLRKSAKRVDNLKKKGGKKRLVQNNSVSDKKNKLCFSTIQREYIDMCGPKGCDVFSRFGLIMVLEFDNCRLKVGMPCHLV